MYFTAKALCGFPDLTTTLHGFIAQWVVDAAGNRKLVLIPRNHYKSSLLTISYPILRIINDPEIRILVASENATLASRFLRRIRNIIYGTHSQMFAWTFPELVPSQKWMKEHSWNDTEICVPRQRDYVENTVETIGVGGAAQSRHYPLIIGDDLVGKEAAESDTVMQKTIEWVHLMESLLVEPTDEILMVGTRWTHSDVYADIINNDPAYKTLILSCFKEDGTPLFPEKYTLESLAAIKARLGIYNFSCQYLNAPTTGDTPDFEATDIRYWKWDPRDAGLVVLDDGRVIDPTLCDVVLLVDPALSKTKRDCANGVIVAAVTPKADIIILEALALRVTPAALVDELFALYKKYRPRVCAVESVQYQESLIYMIEMRKELKKDFFCPCVPVHPRGQAKDARIRSTQPLFRAKQVHLHPEQKLLFRQLMNFPLDRERDLVDALAYGPEVWQIPLSAEEQADYLIHDAQQAAGFDVNQLTGYST